MDNSKDQEKAGKIYAASRDLVPVFPPKDEFTKRLIKLAVNELNSISQTVEDLRKLMNETASKLPEYPVVMAMKGFSPGNDRR